MTTALNPRWAAGITGGRGATALTIMSPPVLPGVNYAQAYPGCTLTAAGGSGSGYTWAVAGGSLPPGFSLNGSTGAITGGTPAGGAATYPFTVQVTDSRGNIATQPSSITITNETLQTITTNSQVNGSGSYYGSNQSAVAGSWGLAPDIQEEEGGVPWPGNGTPGYVLQQQSISYYDPGNWTVTAQEKGPQESPANAGGVYTGPEVFQYYALGAWGTTEPPLSHFTSLTTSYSHVPPAANGIIWPAEGTQAWEFCYDIWLNGFATEIMIWTHTEGPRYPWNGWPTSGSSPIALTNPVSVYYGPTLGSANFGQLVTINCGPGGTPVQYAFGYNYQTNTAQGTGITCPRGPFNFVQVSGTSAFRNTDTGFVNLIGGGDGLLDWLMNYGYIGGTAGAPGISAYTPTMTGINYGVEICSTGGTDYPSLTYGFTSFAVNTVPTWGP